MAENGLLKDGKEFNDIVIFKERFCSYGAELNEITTPEKRDKSVDSNSVAEG